ncbi:hypothetical protein D0T12_27025 [Actinomadura spongiicola]|uniref:Glycosyltransferase RgtA/B/C/D-like domain-containing protein n=1 Tax=Actinomadura spongiicola TaxID=2303421 RepID=A0A372GAQ5_9ACTN|nr:DUF6077 domain-containing protein [Actinomadura spongiicola]RFS82454.1 hypothetical protein D0T12_27025 [Actinomadura spongiicola]
MIQFLDRTAATGERTTRTRATRLVDAFTDQVVLLFAAWTVVFHLGLLFHPSTSGLLLMWLVGAVAIALLYAARRGWWAGPVWREPSGATVSGAAPRAPVVVAVGAGVVAGTCAGLHPSGVPWWCAWVSGIVSVAASTAALLSRRAEPDLAGRTRPVEDRPAGDRQNGDRQNGDRRDGETRWGTPLALLTGAGFAVASLFIVNTDGDDAYFVSRSVATAATGEIPVKDVIFTPGTADEISGEPPVASIEVLAGAVARMLGVHAASFVWYALLPAVTFLAVWALWRLVRAWAPRHAVLCFAVGAVYLLWSGTSRASLGSFHLLRMWQGKAVLVSVLVPLLLVYLTRWAERRSRGDLALLGAAGMAATGLTSSAAFVVPLVVGAAAVALVAAGRVRTGLAACVATVYPIGSGLAVKLFYGDTTVPGTVHDAPGSYRWVLLHGALGVIGGCAVWLSPWTARRGVPALLATGVAAVLTVLIVPGVLETAADLSGAGQVLWRTMWVVPAPALIGLLASVRLPTGRWPGPVRAGAAGVPAVVLVVALVAGGNPVWSDSNGSTVASRPAWKVPAGSVGTARDVVELAGPGGLVLMPTGVMRVVPLLTVRTQAVNPNSHYLKLLPVDPQVIDDRQVLSAAVRRSSGGKPETAEVAAALSRAGVDVACAYHGDERGLALLERAGYGGERRVGNLRCLFPPRS